MNELGKNVKKVMAIFLFLFVALISYLAYFQVFKAPQIAEKPGNRRIWAQRNEVLRGTIYDKEMKPLTKSKRKNTLNQEREYIYGDLFCHALGYVDPVYGLTGLEDSYDKELTTYNPLTNGVRSLFKDFSMESFKKIFDNRDEEKNKIGNSIVTTLDVDLQKAAYNALGDRKGAVIAMNPKTGEVLTMVSNPSFDPNNLDAEMKKANAGTGEESPLLNRTINGLYPPGSTFKTITSLSALENMSDAKTRIFKDNGKITFPDGKTLSNDSGSIYGDINLKRAFITSSNVVYGTLAMELGNDKLKATAEKFGFNENIPAKGFNITNSRFPKLESYEVGNIAQSGIGQSSILSTPMQMALVASAVANDGVIMEPTMVKKIIDKDGNLVKTIKPKIYKEAMSKENANILKDYMKSLIDERIYGQWSYLRGTETAGKTGTADYILPNGNQAVPHSWFIGFAPASAPEIAIAVIVENGGYGSGAATSVAGEVINASLNK